VSVKLKAAKINFANPIIYRTFANEFNALKMMNTFVDTLDDTDVMEMQGDLTPETKADWLRSIEHDLSNPNRGKVHRPIEVLWQKLEDSVRNH